MCRMWEVEASTEIRSEANHKHALSNLGDPVVRSVQQLEAHAILWPKVRTPSKRS